MYVPKNTNNKIETALSGLKTQKLLTVLSGGWYTEAITKGLSLLRRPKLS